jgi:hypothetical protein
MCNCGKKRGVAGGGGRGIDTTTAVPTIARAVPTVAPRAVPTVAPTVVRTVTRAVPTVAPRAVPTVAPRAVPTVTTRPAPTVTTRPVARQVPSMRRIIRRTTQSIINPAIWGPPLWRLLHTLAELRQTDTEWPHLLSTLRSCLPCPDCSHHYNAWVDGHAIDGDMKAWVLALHNDVNRRKDVIQWTPDMVSVAVGAMRQKDLRALLGRIRGKVGEPACKILTSMVDRITV